MLQIQGKNSIELTSTSLDTMFMVTKFVKPKGELQSFCHYLLSNLYMYTVPAQTCVQYKELSESTDAVHETVLFPAHPLEAVHYYLNYPKKEIGISSGNMGH